MVEELESVTWAQSAVRCSCAFVCGISTVALLARLPPCALSVVRDSALGPSPAQRQIPLRATIYAT